jgi:hypothetical protein
MPKNPSVTPPQRPYPTPAYVLYSRKVLSAEETFPDETGLPEDRAEA